MALVPKVVSTIAADPVVQSLVYGVLTNEKVEVFCKKTTSFKSLLIDLKTSSTRYEDFIDKALWHVYCAKDVDNTEFLSLLISEERGYIIEKWRRLCYQLSQFGY